MDDDDKASTENMQKEVKSFASFDTSKCGLQHVNCDGKEAFFATCALCDRTDLDRKMDLTWRSINVWPGAKKPAPDEVLFAHFQHFIATHSTMEERQLYSSELDQRCRHLYAQAHKLVSAKNSVLNQVATTREEMERCAADSEGALAFYRSELAKLNQHRKDTIYKL
jgi:hypothetical protein